MQVVCHTLKELYQGPMMLHQGAALGSGTEVLAGWPAG